MPYRVVVAGPRDRDCPDLARRMVARLAAKHGPIEVIQGGESGVDTSFAEAAWEAGYGVRLYQFEFGDAEAAGPAEGVDMCLAVHPDLSASDGTRACVGAALAAGIPCCWIAGDDGEVRRLRGLPFVLRERIQDGRDGPSP
jgi:hypothetical protein